MPLSRHAAGGLPAGIVSRYARLAASGVAASVAGFESTEAALVFTAPNLSIDPDDDAILGRIDLNGDGLAEVGVTVGAARFPDANGNNGMVQGGGLFGAFIAFDGRYPAAFHASDLISGSLSFRTAIGTLALSSGGLLGSRGGWFGGQDAYLGARFQMNEVFYFGWIHAVWDPASNTMNIDLAAYEDSGGAAQIVEQPAEPENFALSLGSVFDLGAGRIQLVWPVLAGKTYELQRSQGLNEWHTIYSVTPAIDGEESYLDEEFASAPKKRCFYRVKQSEMSLVMLALGVPRRRRRETDS